MSIDTAFIQGLTIEPNKDYIQTKERGTAMKLSTRIKPISYLKAHAAEVLKTLEEERNPLIITQNGEGKAVIQDLRSYEETQETLALLKILALGNKQIDQSRVQPASVVIDRLRKMRDDG